MRRLVGSLLVLYGLAHIGAGVWVVGARPNWIVVLLWLAASAGFVCAGVGLAGAPRLDRFWRPFSVVAALASLVLLALYATPVLMIGAAIDGALLVAAIPFVRETVVRTIGVPASSGILVFEPAHSVMQRGMLPGINERAERAWKPQ